MKGNILAIFMLLCSISAGAQQYSSSTVSLGNFVKRMYVNSPFEGVRVIEDYDSAYLICVLKLDPTKYGNNESVMNRIASVKAMSEANRFFSGSKITTDFVIKTSESNDGCVSTETIERINEKSVGYVKQLVHLINFDSSDAKRVYVYYTLIPEEK